MELEGWIPGAALHVGKEGKDSWVQVTFLWFLWHLMRS